MLPPHTSVSHAYKACRSCRLSLFSRAYCGDLTQRECAADFIQQQIVSRDIANLTDDYVRDHIARATPHAQRISRNA